MLKRIKIPAILNTIKKIPNNCKNKKEEIKKIFKFDYEKDLVRLNMDKEPKIKKIISKYK